MSPHHEQLEWWCPVCDHDLAACLCPDATLGWRDGWDTRTLELAWTRGVVRKPMIDVDPEGDLL